MEAFLLKSTASLIVLLGIYHLFLEKEKMHTFNRFYLLFSLLLSFTIPFITIEIAVESLPKPLLLSQSDSIPVLTQDKSIDVGAATVQKSGKNYIPIILWSLYALTTLFLVIRFGKNIYDLILKAKKSQKVAFNCSTLVLSKEEQLPHTFLQYIFINEDDFNSQNIQQELYTHELTHVRQKHTYDVLFIEILKTLFWFNPILVFYKKAIQLNHEFLADENVVESHKNVSFYQNLLVEKASWNSNFYLASNLNFSVTKKRLIMMTKTTSKSRAFLKKIALVPVLAGLVFASCIEKTAAKDKEQEVWINGERVKESEMNQPISNWKKKQPNEKNQTNEAAYFAGVRFIIYKTGTWTKDRLQGKDIILDKTYEELTAKEKDRFKPYLRIPKSHVKKSPTAAELEDYKDSKKYAIWIDDVNVKNTELNKYSPSDIAYVLGSSVMKNARTQKHPQPFQFHFYTHNYFDKKQMGKAPEKYPLDKVEIFDKIIKN
ncbi:M56 family metallopeptidase [Flavobacterium lindanitolerans]|uniref:Beta-lactamase regulating signal transducer with metallopeptidase domain n=2 Tax=Flavobacterium lindanitolerans TaxID=428988 RepID=A0A497V9L5_9FLAO|nr:M56 family metallopeptidase [Flavobacterium lindanitolerans]PKW28559.1 beta-lactamase regulating signal transducer with metallopeptidase domain [Flavobacterium lindanitolerans]RLJ35936.1 beta-lactamase regulating signal transducer with metallopeptidase domain [Flavobacterium lindanitolerans]